MRWEEYQRFRPAFAKAMDPRLHRIEYLDSLVFSGRARFWASDQAAIVAQLEQYPSGVWVVEGVIAAGELAAVKKLIPCAEEWGRRHGATFAKIESREGWAKALHADGYVPFQLAVMKEL
jgi:hypothetical protein